MTSFMNTTSYLQNGGQQMPTDSIETQASKGQYTTWPVLILVCGFLATSLLAVFSAFSKKKSTQANQESAEESQLEKGPEVVALLHPPDYVSRGPPPYSELPVLHNLHPPSEANIDSREAGILLAQEPPPQYTSNPDVSVPLHPIYILYSEEQTRVESQHTSDSNISEAFHSVQIANSNISGVLHLVQIAH